MTSQLHLQLQQSHHNYITLTDPCGGCLTIVEHGARPLDMTLAKEDGCSAFWFDSSALTSRQNWNIGGDRTWISPEIEYFTNESGNAQVPAQLDPGDWVLEQVSSSQAVAKMAAELQHRSSTRLVHVELEKQFRLLPNPLVMNTSTRLRSLQISSYMGYEVVASMRLQPQLGEQMETSEASASVPAGYCSLWSVLQVPPGGAILAPTYGQVEPLAMFAHDRQHVRMKSLPNGLLLHCEGDRKFKFSLDAISSTGRFGYIRHLNERKSCLIVRQFHVNPSGMYPDYPPGRPDYSGSCMQFYFDGGQLGHFAELEYHSPALRIDAPGHRTDISQLFYFTGSTDDILAIAEIMLGIVPEADFAT